MCDCICCCESKKTLNTCFHIYNEFKCILNTGVLDFYSQDVWLKLPLSWRNAFDNATPDEIAILLDINVPLTKLKKICPLSILALREILKQLNTTRIPQFKGNVFHFATKHTLYKCNMQLESPQVPESNEGLLTNPKLANVFWKHIKLKKRHEITIMAKICSAVTLRSKCNIVIDFGSGLGHLSRLLAYGYGLKVCCLEKQKCLIEEARNLDLQFERIALKYISEDQLKQLNRPVHLNIKIEKHTDTNALIKQIQLALNEINDFEFGIVGLHPCGDLTSILLRFFMQSPNIKFINVVGCCHMKLSTEGTPYVGYPLSEYLLSRKNELSYVVREISCHALEIYIKQLKLGSCTRLKIHAYRAVLEKIIIKYWPKLKHTGLRNVKYTNDLTFPQYCKTATDGMDIVIPEYDMHSKDTNKLLSEWRRVALFFSIKLMFAPMIETIILLDRFLFIAQPDVECSLIPIFDPHISPRNQILVANKHIKL